MTHEINVSIVLNILKDSFVRVRFDIKNDFSLYVLKTLCKLVDEYLALGKISNEHLNEITKYCNISEVKNETVCFSRKKTEEIKDYLQILKEAIAELLRLLEDKKYEQAYDLVDAIHCLPEALVNKSWNSKEYWKIYVQPYQMKWNGDFWKEEKSLFIRRNWLF